MAPFLPIQYDKRVDDNNQDVIVLVPQSSQKSNKAKFQIFSFGGTRRQTRGELLENKSYGKLHSLFSTATRQSLEITDRNESVEQMGLPIRNRHQSTEFKPAQLRQRSDRLLPNPVHNSEDLLQIPEHVAEQFHTPPGFDRNRATAFSLLSQEKLNPGFQSSFIDIGRRNVNNAPQNIIGRYQQNQLTFGHAFANSSNNFLNEDQMQHDNFVDDLDTDMFPSASNMMKPVATMPVRNASGSFYAGLNLNRPMMEASQPFNFNQNMRVPRPLPTEMFQRNINIPNYWPSDEGFGNDMNAQQDLEEMETNTFTRRKKSQRGAGPVHHHFGLQTPLRRKMAQNRSQWARGGVQTRGNNFQGRRRQQGNRRFILN